MSNEIQRLMSINRDYDPHADNPYYIAITANLSELKSIVHISNDLYEIDFNVPNFIGSVLGFTKETIGVGYNESPSIVNVIQINSILVDLDIISGLYVNLRQSNDPYIGSHEGGGIGSVQTSTKTTEIEPRQKHSLDIGHGGISQYRCSGV